MFEFGVERGQQSKGLTLSLPKIGMHQCIFFVVNTNVQKES